MCVYLIYCEGFGDRTAKSWINNIVFMPPFPALVLLPIGPWLSPSTWSLVFFLWPISWTVTLDGLPVYNRISTNSFKFYRIVLRRCWKAKGTESSPNGILFIYFPFSDSCLNWISSDALKPHFCIPSSIHSSRPRERQQHKKYLHILRCRMVVIL